MSLPRIGLSTSSVYPESTAHAFTYAASVGYDAVEVMVGIDALSQQTNAVKQLSEHHAMPISAIHAPCLLFTQRVWGTEPWGKLERSAEMAHGGRRRGGRRAPAVPVAARLRPRLRQRHRGAGELHRHRVRRREHVSLAGLVAARRCEMYVPGWDPSEEPYANTTIDLSHAAIAADDPVAMARGSATGSATST